ncbi:uncharacterized protein BBA_08752 [Beauveria bassiana ARSEF 2860]|uniref:Uncharacterized protein n=1 Tax=Beauveria bassiana (strain ARSEF 2860) TaxID=655819 RepID=J4VV28_BEAB2|nr:uncharacterized protein BBA_08752 [Beauveria bassiana ARSEF 2860]EJP62325.1 hypothetical protein BBA_08752 [Beauveria bassiana ARSEF 2860]
MYPYAISFVPKSQSGIQTVRRHCVDGTIPVCRPKAKKLEKWQRKRLASPRLVNFAD